MVTFKKVKNATAYAWSSVGGNDKSQSAIYEAVVNGETVAVISRAYGGGYMQKVKWEARNTQPMEMSSYPSTTISIHDPGTVVLASGDTLKSVKDSLSRKLTKMG